MPLLRHTAVAATFLACTACGRIGFDPAGEGGGRIAVDAPPLSCVPFMSTLWSGGRPLSYKLGWSGFGYLAAWTADLDGQVGNPRPLHIATIDVAGVRSDVTLATDYEVDFFGLRWLGDAYFVLFSRQELGVWGQAVSASGQALDVARPIIPETSASINIVDLDSELWALYFSSGYRRARLSRDGTLLSIDALMAQGIDSAWTGDMLGVISLSSGSPFMVAITRLDATGNPLGADTILDTGLSAPPTASIVWTGTTFAVLWNARAGTTNEVRLAHVDASGAIVGSRAVLESGLGGTGTMHAWRGTDLAGAWITTGLRIRYAQYARDGTRTAADELLSSGAGVVGSTELYADRERTAMVWHDNGALQLVQRCPP